MAGPLAAVERFFERLFERPAARLFQARVEPVQIERALERAVESERRVHARRAYAPSAFRVLLSETDHTALGIEGSTLARDLAEAVRVYARARDYVLLARTSVEVLPSSAVALGDIRVYAEPVVIAAAMQQRHAPGPSAGDARPAATPPPRPAPDMGQVAPHVAEPDVPRGSHTAIFAAPSLNAPRAQLAIRVLNQPAVRVPVRAGTIRLGRSLDNDVVLADEKVSRHHGQIGVRLGMLVYTDLRSTNGSYLNGSAVTEIALGPGDVLQLGSSTVTIEPAP